MSGGGRIRAMPAANTTQNPIAIPSRWSRRRMARPPITISAIAIASAAAKHRPPPEVEWLGARTAQEHEAENEADVRRVEDVAAVIPDQVLGEQRDRRRPGEDPPPVHAPPVPVHRARDPKDERDTVSGEEQARRPDDRVLLPEGDRGLEHRAHEQRDQDLGDREAEVERHLPQDLQRHDHGREVQPGIAQRRQQHRVRRAADPYAAARSRHVFSMPRVRASRGGGLR